jgi:hypothetical protein
MNPLRVPLLLGALTLLGLPAAAQGGAFAAHDLFVYGNLGGSPADGVARVNPLTGATAVLTKFTGAVFGTESMAFDAYRQRLIFMARFGPSDGPAFRPYLMDGNGALTPLEPPNTAWTALAPTGDGRIYFRDGGVSSTPLKWIDAANQIHTLYGTDGVTPFTMDGYGDYIEDMLYVPSESALVAVTSAPHTLCPGGSAQTIHLRKLPLTADGSRLSGPMLCGEFDVNPNDAETSHGISLMSDGDLLVGAHNGLYGPPLPRLFRVDPTTLATSAFASFGDASNGGITWSSALGKAVTQTHFTSGLLAYSDGQVDDGTAVPSTLTLSLTRYALEEIPSLPCEGGWIAYGKGLAGAGGAVPRLYGAGCPAPGAAVTLRVDQVVGGTGGALRVGFAPLSVAFAGGLLLVAPPGPQINLFPGGAFGQPGAGALALPVTLPSDPGLTGVSLYLQAGFYDPAAVQSISLSQGLELELG